MNCLKVEQNWKCSPSTLCLPIDTSIVADVFDVDLVGTDQAVPNDCWEFANEIYGSLLTQIL
jgi:hypothetical protein